MRLGGTLIKWNEQRGFGFISVAGEPQEIFVHISAFEQRGIRPRIGEALSFEKETRPDGRQHAVRVRQFGQAAPASARRSRRPPRKSSSPVAALVVLSLIGVAFWLYNGRTFRPSAPSTEPAASILLVPPTSTQSVHPPAYRCDGRTHCSQMKSCAEARYFLQHCPNTQMDGDGDGVPCEQQWCSF